MGDRAANWALFTNNYLENSDTEVIQKNLVEEE